MKRRPRAVDVLAKVRLMTGGEQWILLHLEVQSGREAGFTVRIARSNSGLFDFRSLLDLQAWLDAHEDS